MSVRVIATGHAPDDVFTPGRFDSVSSFTSAYSGPTDVLAAEEQWWQVTYSTVSVLYESAILNPKSEHFSSRTSEC
eukprot:183150-Prorocentrum_minimum.AAC.2